MCRHAGQTLKVKPVVVHDYNQHMLGVDKLDQLASYYSFLHKSVKWWRKVFFWLVEVTVVNSYILYKQQMAAQKRRPLTHLGFRRELISSLSEPIRSTVPPNRRSGSRVRPLPERLQPVPHFMRKGTKRRDCWVCSCREEGGIRHLTLYFCTTCHDHPPPYAQTLASNPTTLVDNTENSYVCLLSLLYTSSQFL